MIQLLLNFLFRLFNSFFSLIGSLTAPDWISDLLVGILEWLPIVNYYFPLGTLVSVVSFVISFNILLMLISVLLQLL